MSTSSSNKPSPSFDSGKWNPTYIPDLTGKIALITGGHAGLGLATTIHLARKGARVYVASRDVGRAEEVIEGVRDVVEGSRVSVVEMNLSDLESVKRGVDAFLSKEKDLHILINNAGIMCTPYTLTPQNLESQFQVNYLSHYLLTALVLPTLIRTASINPAGTVRIVNVSSDGHAKLAPKTGVHFEDMNLEGASVWTRYGHSKLCQVLHTKSLAERYGEVNGGRGIAAVSLHPGTVKTALAKGPRGSTWWYKFIQPLVEIGAPGPERGCWGIVWCAASQELRTMLQEDGGKGGSQSVNGGYFEGVGRLSKASKFAEDMEMGRALYDWSLVRCRALGVLDNDALKRGIILEG